MSTGVRHPDQLSKDTYGSVSYSGTGKTQGWLEEGLEALAFLPRPEVPGAEWPETHTCLEA